MNVRDARRGAALAGAMLLTLPLIEVLFGARTLGVEHLTIAICGLWLVGISATGRL